MREFVVPVRCTVHTFPLLFGIHYIHTNTSSIVLVRYTLLLLMILQRTDCVFFSVILFYGFVYPRITESKRKNELSDRLHHVFWRKMYE
jgi:hypothetical protein